MLAMALNDDEDYYERRSRYRAGVVAAICFIACALIVLALVLA